MSLGTKKFVITRFDPDRDTEPRTEEYEIPVQSDWKVLDAINFIKDEIDGSLSYRWSCRMAVCGSCGMMVERRTQAHLQDRAGFLRRFADHRTAGEFSDDS